MSEQREPHLLDSEPGLAQQLLPLLGIVLFLLMLGFIAGYATARAFH